MGRCSGKYLLWSLPWLSLPMAPTNQVQDLDPTLLLQQPDLLQGLVAAGLGLGPAGQGRVDRHGKSCLHVQHKVHTNIAWLQGDVEHRVWLPL